VVWGGSCCAEVINGKEKRMLPLKELVKWRLRNRTPPEGM